MALYVGSIKCAFCGLEITDQNEATHFPQFVWNQADPLFIFGDASVHDTCLINHPLASRVQQRLEEFRKRTSPENRLCSICGKQITDPDDYLGLGYLTENEAHPLYRFNYSHFHRSCIRNWEPATTLISGLELYDRSGAWKGGGLKWLIGELRKLSAPL